MAATIVVRTVVVEEQHSKCCQTDLRTVVVEIDFDLNFCVVEVSHAVSSTFSDFSQKNELFKIIDTCQNISFSK